jgi:hypothetical protein
MSGRTLRYRDDVLRVGVDGIDEYAHVLRIYVADDPVTQVGDVALCAELFHHLLHAFLQLLLQKQNNHAE